MQKLVLLLLVLLFSQVLAKTAKTSKKTTSTSTTSADISDAIADLNLDYSSPTACTKPESGDSSGSTFESKLFGVSGFLLPFLALAPEADLLVAELSAGYAVWSYLDGGGSSSSKETDYTNELAECLKEWVSVEIDQTLWEAAKEAHAEAVTQMGNLVGKINSTIGGDPNDSTNNPNVVLEEVDVYYGRIFDAKNDIKMFYGASIGDETLKDGNNKTATAELLQLNLDILSMQAHAGLIIATYAADNRDTVDEVSFVSKLETYRTDVQNFIDYQFGDDDAELSLQLIFDQSPTATEWMNSIEETSSGDCRAYVNCWLGCDDYCGDDTAITKSSYCKVYDAFRKFTFVDCDEACDAENEHCYTHCNWDRTCKPYVEKAKKYVSDSLVNTKGHIQDGKRLQQQILIQMKNLVGCDCNVAGTESCDLDTKKCTCRYNVTGDKCDQCTNGETFPDCVHTYIELTGPQDVGGTCPSPDTTFSYLDTNCCCGGWQEQEAAQYNPENTEWLCCWNKCNSFYIDDMFKDNDDYMSAIVKAYKGDIPDDCLDVPNSEWILQEDGDRGYFRAVQVYDG